MTKQELKKEQNKRYKARHKDQLKEYQAKYYRKHHPKVSVEEYMYRAWLNDFTQYHGPLSKDDILQKLVEIENNKKIINADYIMVLPDLQK